MSETPKYTDAIRVMLWEVGISGHGTVPDVLFAAVRRIGYSWDGEMWVKRNPESTSIFADADGNATGAVRLRVMAHPDDVEAAVEALRKVPGMWIAEVSDKAYPNRKSAGVRVYVTAWLKGKE